jgi:hypothetical protein
MQLSDYVGESIAMVLPFLHTTKIQKVKLLGVEAGGVWIQSQEFINLTLQKLEQPTAPKTMVLFVPYHGIALALASIEGPSLNEKAFGV